MTTVAMFSLYFDSKYRNDGTNPAPVFNLSTPITLSNPNHRFVATVKSVDIPFSFKSLTAPYNTLVIDYDESPNPAFSFTITIPPGNYSISILLSTFLSLVNAGIVAGGAANPPAIGATYDKNTGKVTFTIAKVSGASATTVVFFWTGNDLLAEFFGFLDTANTTLSYNPAGVPSYINNISPIHVNCSPISSLYIRSTTLTQPSSSEEELTEFTTSVSDILLKVPVTSPYNSWLYYQNSDVEVMLNNRIIDTIQFYVTALTYDTINFDGVHWKIHLQIKEVRDEWVDRAEEENRKATAELQRLENERARMLRELEGLQGEMQTKLPSLQQVAVTPEEQKEADQKVLENELMAEVEANREAEKMA